MGWKEELRRRYYEMSLAMTGKTPTEIQESLKKGLKEKKFSEFKVGGLQLNWPIRLFIIFLIILQAFFPFVIWQLSITFLIILIVGIIAVCILAYFTGGTVLSFLNIITSIMVPIAVVVILSFLTQGLGSPNYYQVLSIKYGTLVAALAFVVLASLGSILAVFVKSPLGFIIVSLVFAVFLFLILPFALASVKVYGLCLKIPYLSQYCSAKETYVEPLKTVKIPVTGGISLKFGTEETNWQPVSTLYAGEPYEFTFILTNYYEQPITFDIKPSMLSSYGSKINFVQEFTPRKNTLDKNEYYQDSVLMDPDKMKVEESNGCPYTSLQINKTQNIPVEKIKCSYDKPCENPKYACVKTGNFECDCVDWTIATCSRNSLKAKVQVKHTGFFRGNASLYYSVEQTSPSHGFELTQGPLSVIVEFQPNPYISAIHQYRKDVTMYVTFENGGGDITIKDFKVEPQNTIVHTIDKEKEVELIEEVGTQVINCRNIDEIIPSGFLPSGEEAGGKLCTLTPPSVKTTLRDLKQNQVIEINNITYDRINYYCNKEKYGGETGEKGYTYWSSNWDKIYETIQSSGVCDILKSKEREETPKIESSLTHTEVIIEFSYERSMTYQSQDIVPYTRTEECMKLEESTK